MSSDHRFLMIADEAVDHLERLMKRFPHLASEHVQDAVENWQKRGSGGIEMVMPGAEADPDEALAESAIALIQDHMVEDVMDRLAEENDVEVDYDRLIGLVGKDRYIGALRREIIELRANSVSMEQMAELWNSLGKPALGQEQWTARTISLLLG